MKILFFGFFSLTLCIGAIASPISNCANDEQVLFSCTSGKKTLSLCAPSLKSKDDYLEYRFSQPGKSSFFYRADSNNPERVFLRAQVTGASSMSTMIWFENDGYAYILNDPVKGYPSISVRRSKKEISRIQCTENFDGDSEIANPHIQEKKSEDYFNLLH